MTLIPIKNLNLKLTAVKMDMKKLIFLLTATAMLAGCSSEDEVETAEETVAETTPTVSEQRVMRQRRNPEPPSVPEGTQSLTDPARELPRLTGELEQDGYGPTMIIDGSSPEAFRQSVELIAADSSEKQYRDFNAAVRFLRTYTLGARDLEEFYQTLDGMTPEEVIEMVSERRGRSRRR